MFQRLADERKLKQMKAKGPKESVAQLQVKLYEAEQNSNDSSIAAAKEKLEAAKSALKVKYDAKAAEPRKVIAEKSAEVKEAAKQLREAQVNSSSRVRSVQKKYDDMLKEQNAKLAAMEEEIRNQRQEALDKLKELNSTGVR